MSKLPMREVKNDFLGKIDMSEVDDTSLGKDILMPRN